MSVESYLKKRASDAVLSMLENNSIKRSILTLECNINTHFGSDVREKFRFGSSTRGTILPRTMDLNSDIDYMIIFDDDNCQPQTYLDRLKRFVNKYYPRSLIKQSYPTIVLELNHIKFDLVPAIKDFRSGYKIPDKNNNWQHTDPKDFNATLTSVNMDNSSLLKPAIRLTKYWNANNGHIYDSYNMEKDIVDLDFRCCRNQKDYLFKIFDMMSTWGLSRLHGNKVAVTKKIVQQVKWWENNGHSSLAENEIKKLIPE